MPGRGGGPGYGQVCRERTSAEPLVVGRPPPWPARPRARYPVCRSGGDGVVTEAAGGELVSGSLFRLRQYGVGQLVTGERQRHGWIYSRLRHR